MKKYTQEDFDNIEVNELGYKICPSGDYTEIKAFPAECYFGDYCRFGDYCSFGDYCGFGGCCSFGNYCRFGGCCSFGDYCRFGERCRFGGCCSFGYWCRFGGCCRFGDWCGFGKDCIFENEIKLKEFLKFEGFGSTKRCTYFWLSIDNEVYVRCGCFFGSIDEFRKQVKDVYGSNKYAQGYLKIADLAEWYWKLEDEA